MAVADAPGKYCVVVYATRERQYLWTVGVASEATIADAIEAARQQVRGAGIPFADLPDIPWETGVVGVFGELRERSDIPNDGDRVEIYRPLRSDPRDRRRERVQRLRKSAAR